MSERALLSWSGGKDSALALHALQRTPGVEVGGLLTTVTEDVGRISMHGVRRSLRKPALGGLLATMPIRPPEEVSGSTPGGE